MSILEIKCATCTVFLIYISLNNVTVVLKMLEENQMHLRRLAFAGVWIFHKIKSQLVVKYRDKYVQIYLV